MQKFLTFVFWLATKAIILGAFFTNLPVLVTISTALYWIISITIPTTLVLVAVLLLIAPEGTYGARIKAIQAIPTRWFILGQVQGFISLGVYATVGWAFPFTMLMVVAMLNIYMRFSEDDVAK